MAYEFEQKAEVRPILDPENPYVETRLIEVKFM